MQKQAFDADQNYKKKPKQGGKRVKGKKDEYYSDEDEDEVPKFIDMKAMR